MRVNFDSIVTHWLKPGFCALLASTVVACGGADTGEDGTAIFTESPEAFVERVQAESLEISREAEAAYWVRATYITPDTAVLAAKAGERQLAFASGVVAQAKQYAGVETDPQTRRILDRLLTGTAMPAPEDAGMQAELATLATEMEGMYGAGKSCDESGTCRNLGELEKIMESSRDYDQLLEAWLDWRSVSVPMRPMYRRFVELMNAGAREYGYADVGALWKSGYEMEVDAFERETERLWSQVEPLYEQLHCHVRAKLGEQYGDQLVPADGPIPAHLLGNMWSQTWGNIYPLVEPYPGVSEWDISAALVEQGYDEVRMTKLAESFFTSLGLPELPASFWTNSLLRKPADREVVCHASAWDMGNGNDPRIKQCVEPTAGQLGTLHHELGHIYYFLMYRDQLPFFRDGAHDGFHEAIGDTIELSMTQRLPETTRPARRSGDKPRGNHQPANENGAGQNRLPALRQTGRSMALESILRGNRAGKLQSGMVGPAHRLPGYRRPGAPFRSGFRPRRQVPHPRQHALHPLFSVLHHAVPVPPVPV